MENSALKKILEVGEAYSTGVCELSLDLIERNHGIVAFGVPLLAIVAAYFFAPKWVLLALELTIIIPAAIGLTIGMVRIWPHIK